MRIMVQAHRGASAYAPENTAPAFRLAVEMHADGVENDVRFSKDKVLVVGHDGTVDRVSDGKGRVHEMTLAELKQLDYGVKRGPQFAGTRICTLTEFLDIVRDMKIINIEFKPIEHPDVEPAWACDQLYDAVARAGVWDHTIVSSFDFTLLKLLKERHADVRTALLYGHKMTPAETVALVRSVNGDIIHPELSCINKWIVDRCRREGIDVNVWTVDKPRSIRRAIELGVTGIITNVPDRVLEAVRAAECENSYIVDK